MKPFDENGAFRVAADGGGLRRLAVRGAGVTVFSQSLGFAIQMIATVILARLLTPADFGLVTMVTTFSLLLMNFGLNGFTEAVLQREEIDHALASNLFWINIGLGLLLTVGFAAAGPLLARFYGDPRVAPVAVAMSVAIFFTSVSVQHLALLKRAMRFSVVSTNDILARAVSVAVSILLGWAAWGYWALVAGAVALPLAMCAGAWTLCRWVPGLPRRGVGTGPMVRFAMNTYGRFAANYFTRNLDNLLVGWCFGPRPLGFYKKAYDLFVLPANQLSAPLTAVAVSALSRLNRDPGKQGRHFLSALSALAFVGMGLGAGLTLMGKELILVLLGPGWEESGRIFTFFGPGIGMMLLYGTHGWIHLSIGRADRWFRWAVVEFAVTGLLFLAGLQWGVAGIALAWVVSFWILTIPALWYAGRPARLGIAPVIGAVWRYVLASALAGGASAVIIGEILPLPVASGLIAAIGRIVVISALFGALYLCAVILLHRGPAPLIHVAGLLRDMVPGGRLSRSSLRVAATAWRQPQRVSAPEGEGKMSQKTLLLFSLIVVCLSTPSYPQTNPEIISADRTIDWSQAGVPGGIPNRANGTCATLNPDATATDINNAIAACSNGVVFLNAGTYALSSGITFGGGSNVTLRGAGPDQTIVRFTGADPCGGLSANVCIFAPSNIYPGNIPSSNLRNWTAGYAKGTTQITLESTAGVAVGRVLVLDQLDDQIDTGGVFVACGPGVSLEVCPPTRSGRSQQQYVQATSIDGNQVTISPGLYMPNWRASQEPQVWWWGTGADMNGVENLTLDHTNSNETSGIFFHGAYGGWVKNVKSLNANRGHVWFHQSARIEVRDSYFYGTKNAAVVSYGVEFFMTSDTLLINNIVHHITAPILMGPSAGSVVAYNFVIDMYYVVSPDWMVPGLAGAHGAGIGMNLFEGNVGNAYLMDTAHGTGNLATLFRNRLAGTEPDKVQDNTIPVNLWAYNRLVNIVGNVLGTSGYHTVYEDSQAPSGTTGSPDRSIYVLGYPASGEQDPFGGIPYDPVVVSSLLRWGNYDYATNQTRWDPAEIPADSVIPATQTLPPSLFLSSRPSWWGTMPWPPIGPDVTGGEDQAGHTYRIPAQVCYDNSPKNPDGTLMFNADSCYGSTPP